MRLGGTRLHGRRRRRRRSIGRNDNDKGARVGRNDTATRRTRSAPVADLIKTPSRRLARRPYRVFDGTVYRTVSRRGRFREFRNIQTAYHDDFSNEKNSCDCFKTLLKNVSQQRARRSFVFVFQRNRSPAHVVPRSRGTVFISIYVFPTRMCTYILGSFSLRDDRSFQLNADERGFPAGDGPSRRQT